MNADIEKSVIKVAESFKVIAHPLRIKILMLLRGRNNLKMSVSEIQEILNLSQPVTSRHLLLMKSNDILQSIKEGSSVYYFINRENPVSECLVMLQKNL